MKTNVLTRIYAMVMSAVFAAAATVGTAVLMSASGEHARTEFSAKAAAQQSPQATSPALTQWQAPRVTGERKL